MCTVWPCQLDECKLQCSIAALHSHTIKHKWYVYKLAVPHKTLALISVNSPLLKKPYSGKYRILLNVSYESAMSGEYIWAQRSHP